MARWIVEDIGENVLDRLTPDVQRKIRMEMVKNGANVLQKEIQAEMDKKHHVRSGAMKSSVAVGPVYEDVDGTSVDVWPQGNDSRGVSNEMKLHIIEYGYYNSFTGVKHKKQDFFLNDRFRKRCAPRIVAVMQATLSKCMDEIDK